MLFIGVYMILCPSSFMAVTLSVFAVYMIFDGVRGIVSFFRFRDMPGGVRSAVLAKSIITAGSGITIIAMAIARPDLLMPIFVYIAGAHSRSSIPSGCNHQSSGLHHTVQAGYKVRIPWP